MNEVFEKIRAIVEDIADIPKDEISLDSELIDDLDLASLEVVSIVSKIEKEFSIKISEKELLSLATMEDVVELVAGKQ